jgi:hypothetical protein
LVIDPGLPLDEFSVETKLIGLSYRKDSCNGYYYGVNHGKDELILQVTLPKNLTKKEKVVKVNCNEVAYSQNDEFLKFKIPIVEGKKTTWEVKLAT